MALPWSKYTCTRCGSVFAGTLLRAALTPIVVFSLGYVVMRVLKGRPNAVSLLLALGLTLMVFVLNLPHQLRRIDRVEHPHDL
ncbi:MAG: hypothetical protein KAJ04_04510 [Candidatus Eisenbacteria sp.]|nr:hypothetical protein [Candidatus Eisenbacteria bacterium]